MEAECRTDTLPSLTPFDSATMVQSLDEDGRGLRVVFFRSASAPDQYGHVIATVENGKTAERVEPRLISREGAAPDGWPLSPPLQSLAIEERPAGSVALLVGMAGQSHWSASFEALPDRRLIIDVACRLASMDAEPRLRSLYLTTPTWQVVNLQFGPELTLKMSASSFALEVHGLSQRSVRWKYTFGPKTTP